MSGIFLKYIFAFLWTSTIFAVIRRQLIKKENPKLEYILWSVFSLVIITIISFSIVDFQEYKSFNQVKFKEITEIRIDKKLVAENVYAKFFEELKYDKFTWVNHPKVIQKHTVTVITQKRKYSFLIENTSNQGVLVSRINQNGNSYVTNRNDYLLQYLE